MTTRAPKVGDYVCVGGSRSFSANDGRHTGHVARIVAVRDTSVTLDARKDDRAIVIRGDHRYSTSDPWRVLTYVGADEAARWLAARDAVRAWRDAIPDGARWAATWGRDDYTSVDIVRPTRIDIARPEDPDASATIYTAVAAWLRAKPDPDDLLIAVEVAS